MEDLGIPWQSGLHTFTATGPDSLQGRWTEILEVVCHGPKNKQKKWGTSVGAI